MGLQEFRGLMSRACNEAWLQQLTYERLQAGVSSAPQDPTADYEHPEQGSYPKTIPLTPFGSDRAASALKRWPPRRLPWKEVPFLISEDGSWTFKGCPGWRSRIVSVGASSQVTPT